MTLACPACGGVEFEVVNTRPRPQGVLRRRRCLACEERFSTLEVLAESKNSHKHGAGRPRKYTALQHLHADLTAALQELGLTEDGRVKIGVKK